MANVIKILEQQLMLRLLEERKQYMSQCFVDEKYIKDTNKLMRILSDEKNNQVANNILLTKKANVMENVTDYKQILN